MIAMAGEVEVYAAMPAKAKQLSNQRPAKKTAIIYVAVIM